MQQMKNASLSAGGSADKLANMSGVSPTVNDSNTAQRETQVQLRIVPLLQHGERQAMTSAALCSVLGCDARQLWHYVRNERESGAMILSGNCGYFLPSLDTGQAHEEMMRCYLRLSSQTFSTFQFLRRLGELLNISPQQITLGGVMDEQTETVSKAGI